MADARALADRALALERAGDPVAALALLSEAAALAPADAALAARLALLHEQEGDYEAAAEAWRRALRLRPGDPELRRALQTLPSRAARVARLLAEGVALAERDRLDEAAARFGQVLALAPRSVVARGNLAALALRRGALAEALAGFEQALRLAGPSLDAERVRADQAVALLLAGDFARGWAAFEARWLLPGYREAVAALAMPRWTGAEPVCGRRVLLLAEQGFGDTIQFVRYARLLGARGAEVVLMVPAPLMRLLAPLGEVHPLTGPVPPADWYCPMLSLPLAFATTLATIPAAIPYLAGAAGPWRERLAALPGLKVGLAWAGGAHRDESGARAMDRRRSIAPALLAPLGAVAGVSWVSLQKEREAGPGFALADWMAECADFADTAGLVAGLDLVITVDTAIAHLAGALGRPVWLLNRFDTCWRWLRGRDDSPWYPTLRQFRQRAPDSWPEVIARVAAALGGRADPAAPSAAQVEQRFGQHPGAGEQLFGR